MIGIIMLLVAILCGLAVFREVRRKNFFGAAYAFLAFAVFGWFSVMTIYSLLTSSGA